MRRLTVAAAALLLLAPRASAAQAHRVVITRADIERAGWTRLSDLLAAAGWAHTSTDGFTFDASPDGLPVAALSDAGLPAWTVLLDGQPVPVRVAGVRLLELAPVSIVQVESVTVTHAPALVAGRVAPRGVLHVHTRRATRPAARALYAIGNERGDPGPYRYTPLTSPNVERLGPDATAALFAGGAHAEAQLSARYSTLNVTDEALLPRIHPELAATGRAPYQKVTSVAGGARVRAGGGTHGVAGGVSRFDGLLIQPRRDDWARVTLAHAGGAGETPLGGLLGAPLALGWSAGWSHLEADTLPPQAARALVHAQQLAQGHLELTALRPRARLGAGVAAGRARIATDDGEQARGDVSAFARAATRDTAGWGGELVVAAVRASGMNASKGIATLRHRSARAGDYSLTVGRAPSVAGEQGDWLEGAQLRGAQVIAAEGPVLSWADVGWSRTVGEMRLDVGAGALRAEGWRVRSVEEAHEGGDATIVRGHARLSTRLGGVATATADYRLALPTSSDPTLDRALQATPRHQARAQVGTDVRANFRFTATLALRSPTEWDLPQDSLGARRLAPLARLDATVEKRLARDRVRVWLAARNLLDREERYAPDGAHFGLRVFLGADVELR